MDVPQNYVVRGSPKKSLSVRMTVEGVEDLKYLAGHFRQSQVAILERLVAEEARRARSENPAPPRPKRAK